MCFRASTISLTVRHMLGPFVKALPLRRAGVKLPRVTVCFKDLNVSTTVYVGSRALPSTLNAYRNIVEVGAQLAVLTTTGT